MYFFTAIALASSLASAVYAFCGADAGSKAEIDEVQRQIQSLLQSRMNIANKTLSKGASFTVPVIWNVLYDFSNPGDGNISDSVITQTHDIVNSFFNVVGLNFEVQSINRIAATYAYLHGLAPGNGIEAVIKGKYHSGDVQTLNIYTVGKNPDIRDFAWSSFPWEYQDNPQNDGIVCAYAFLPVTSIQSGHNSGKIMVHEIGHWGCDGGDYVDDTPAEASPADECPVGRDTCLADGVDPIGKCSNETRTHQTINEVDNMMDYSNDDCRTRFTYGQYNRFAQILFKYRGINLYG